MAERMHPEPRIYFPYQLGHRGRAYPVPQLINPQSDHIGRSLLEFGEGKVLGERGAYWLKIHIANCYWKGNKVSFEQRIAWFDQHEQELLAFANNPLVFSRYGTKPISRGCSSPLVTCLKDRSSVFLQKNDYSCRKTFTPADKRLSDAVPSF